MDKKEIIDKTIDFVKKTLEHAEGGHDWWHIYRVWNNAKIIAASENGNINLFVVELGALLHDIADSKFHNGDETVGPQIARQFLSQFNIDENIIVHVELIIRHISFKGGNFEQEFKSPELGIVQDADRLDAMGAIGIARTFNYGGHKGRAIYNPEVKPNMNLDKEEYKKRMSPSLNNFYEKLLLLKDKIKTKKWKELALERHTFMQKYLEQFYKEWNNE